MQSNVMLTAVFEELMQAEEVEEACQFRYPALSDYLERARAHLWAAQQEKANRHRERPEP